MKDEPEETEFRSSTHDIKQFQTNPVWWDIKAYLEDRLEAYIAKLKGAEDIGEVRFLQGGIANLEDILDLPDQLLDWVEDKQQDEERDG